MLFQPPPKKRNQLKPCVALEHVDSSAVKVGLAPGGGRRESCMEERKEKEDKEYS